MSHFDIHNMASRQTSGEAISITTTNAPDASQMLKFIKLQADERSCPKNNRNLTTDESDILATIDVCFKSWYEPWKKTYLADGTEFEKVYELMKLLLNYEEQIKKNPSCLPKEKTDTIAKIVARLVDYGNAILKIDMIVRTDDGTLKEIDPKRVTTIQLFHAHIYSHNWRNKLLRDYFEQSHRPKSLDASGNPYQEAEQSFNDVANTSVNHLCSSSVGSSISYQLNQAPTKYLSPPLERPLRTSLPSPRASFNYIPIIPESPGCLRLSPSAQFEYLSQSFNQSRNDLLNKQVEIGPLISLIESEAFKIESTRKVILPTILEKIKNLMTGSQSVEKLTKCFELLGILLDTIERISSTTRTNEVTMIASALLNYIVKKVNIHERDSYVEFQHAYWTTFLISIIRLMEPRDFHIYLRNNFSNLAETSDFLKDYLHVVKRFISAPTDADSRVSVNQDLDSVIKHRQPYPIYWIEMTLLACSTFLNSLDYLNQEIHQMFNGNIGMSWGFIDCVMHFLTHEILRPNRHMLKRRQRLLADQMTQTLTYLIWDAWNGIDDRNAKEEMIEDMIGPLLHVTMILKPEDRKTLGPIFYDMARCDYMIQYGKLASGSLMSGFSTINSRTTSKPDASLCGDGYIDHSHFFNQANPHNSNSDKQEASQLAPNTLREASIMSRDGTVLTKFTHLIIGKLNSLMIDKGLGDETFCNDLRLFIAGESDCESYNISDFCRSEEFEEKALDTANLVVEFMKICLDYKQANKFNYRHAYLLCIFNLIMFFKDKVQKSELYSSYLYRLFYLNYAAQRYVEAGFTLLELANSLECSEHQADNIHRVYILELFKYSITDYISLKSFLYERIMHCFDEGQLWEAAIPVCQELAEIYKNITFEYHKLAVIYQRMSQYVSNIVTYTNSRNRPEYYRVSFYGSGFPKLIRNATMVYRGGPFEKLDAFTAKMVQKYPDAIISKSKTEPTEAELVESGAKYMLINSCSPMLDLKSIFGSNLSKINDALSFYYKYNSCDKFYFDRTISDPYELSNNNNPDDVGNLWLERTILTTSTLPGILPFFKVICNETKIITPIENAIEHMNKKNEELRNMINRFKADKHHTEDVRQFTQLLSGIINPAVNGGITKYEEAFFAATTPTKATTITSTTQPPTTLNILAENPFQEPLLVPLPKMQQSNGKHTYVHDLASLLSPTPTRLDINCTKVNMPQTTTNVYNRTQNPDLVDKLKRSIAQQVPLLEEALRLHSDRVADVMKPQHEHLEACYKKLKDHIRTKYYSFLPQESRAKYKRSARSPNRLQHLSTSGAINITSSCRGSLTSSFNSGSPIPSRQKPSNAAYKNMSFTECNAEKSNPINANYETNPINNDLNSSIPYKHFDNNLGKQIEAEASKDQSLNIEIAPKISGESQIEERHINKDMSSRYDSRARSLPVLFPDGLNGMSELIEPVTRIERSKGSNKPSSLLTINQPYEKFGCDKSDDCANKINRLVIVEQYISESNSPNLETGSK